MDDRLQVNSLDRWRDVAVTAEQASLDALFFADVLGLYDVYGGPADAARSAGSDLLAASSYGAGFRQDVAV